MDTTIGLGSASADTFTGLFINLDRSDDRRQLMEKELARYGLKDRYQRFPAVDGATLRKPTYLKPGEMGCFLSHCAALELVASSDRPAHIIEDDVLFSTHTEYVVRWLAGSELIERYDLIYLDVAPFFDLLWLASFKRMYDSAKRPDGYDFKVMDLAKVPYSCLASYLVGPKSARNLAEICNNALRNGARKPLDILFRDLVRSGNLRAACVFPFPTGIRLDYDGKTTTPGRAGQEDNPLLQVTTLLRYMFFTGHDLGGCGAPFLNSLEQKSRRETDAHHTFIVRAVDYLIGQNVKQF